MRTLNITIEQATEALVRLAEHLPGGSVPIGRPFLASRNDGEVVIATTEAWFFPEQHQVSRLIELARANELTVWSRGTEIKRVIGWRGETDNP